MPNLAGRLGGAIFTAAGARSGVVKPAVSVAPQAIDSDKHSPNHRTAANLGGGPSAFASATGRGLFRDPASVSGGATSFPVVDTYAWLECRR
jgi:hypothetical protein